MHSLFSRTRIGAITHRTLLAGPLLSLAVGTALYLETADSIERDAEERFASMVRSAEYSIKGRVKAYRDLLNGTAGLFQTVPDLSRSQFHRYVETLHLDTEFPGIESINYARQISEAERPRFEQQLQAELAAMTPPVPFTHINPPGRRDQYQVLTYLEPATLWPGRFGVDLRYRPVSNPPLAKLRELAAHAEDIKEGERKRIAREIHDDLGQNLLALRIEADMLRSRTRGKHRRLHARAAQTVSQIDSTIKSVRQIINDLRPGVLDLGLAAAVDWQTAEFTRLCGIACEVVIQKEVVVNDHRATAFFRILQESLSNVVRHARATHVLVELKLDGNTLSMTVADDGVGIPPAARAKPGSFGLVGIEERMNMLDGTFTIQSTQGVGTTLTVSAPLAVSAVSTGRQGRKQCLA